MIRVNDTITLDELRPTDRDDVVAYLREKEIYDRTLRIPYPYTAADFDTWLKIVADATQQHGRPLHWAVRDASDRLLGGCGFDGLQLGVSHQAEIGYWLAKPYWGGGIMTDVVRTLCTLAFDELGLAKVTAHVFADNRASARVLEKNGFEREGFLRRHYRKEGRFLDAILFGKLKND